MTDTAGLKHHLDVLWEFFIHVTVGTLLFVIIYMPAFGLHLLVQKLSGDQKDYFIEYVMFGAECAIVIADSILLLAFLAITTWRSIKRL